MADPQTYHITDPSTGKTLTLQGESPPTEQELNDIFSQVHGTTTSTPAESPSWMSLAGTAAKTVAKDVVLGGPAMVWDAAKNAYAREQAGNQAMSSGDFLGAVKHYALENPIAHLVGEPMAHEAQQAVESTQQGRYSEAMGHGVASALPVIGPTAAGIGSQIGSGDPTQQAEAVGHLAAMALGPKALEYGMKGIGAGVSAVRGMVPEQASTTLMMRAANPSAARVGFPERLPSAMNDLKAVEVARGTPAADLDGVLADIKTAKQANREQYSQLKDPQAQRGAVVDGTPIAKAMEDSIPLRTRQQNPAKAQQIMARAETYRRDIPVMEVDQLLQETNADLDSYFGKNPAARQSAKTSNPDIADKVAEASALRDQLYAKLDEPTGGDAARELQRRYGALSDLDRALQAQRIKALRMKPDAMVEGLGKLAAAGKFAKAGVRAMSGDPMGALMDVAQGVAERKMGQYIAESRTTDALIRRAMAVHQQLPSPIQMPQPPVIRGLLGPGAIRLPDVSDTAPITVRGQYGTPVQFRPGQRALPAGQSPAIPLGPRTVGGLDPSDVPGITVRGEYGAKVEAPPPHVPPPVAAPPPPPVAKPVEASPPPQQAPVPAEVVAPEPTPRARLRETMNKPLPVKAYKGVYYYPEYADAKAALAAADWPEGRIVSYQRGYAVQKIAGGTYLGPAEPKIAPAQVEAAKTAQTPTEALKAAEDAYDSASLPGHNADFPKLRQDIETAKQAVLDERARKNAPTAGKQDFSPPASPIQSDPHYVRGTASKAPAVVKPVAPTAPVAAPETAVKAIAKQVERVIDVSGAKNAGVVRQRIIEGLQQELESAQKDAGFGAVTIERTGSKGSKYATLTAKLDGKPVARIDRGDVRILTDDVQGYTDTKGHTTYEGPEPLLALQEKGIRLTDLTPSEQEHHVALAVSAAFGRAKGAGQVVMRIPGDGVFTVERNPYAIGQLLQRVKTSSPQMWKDLVKK